MRKIYLQVRDDVVGNNHQWPIDKMNYAIFHGDVALDNPGQSCTLHLTTAGGDRVARHVICGRRKKMGFQIATVSKISEVLGAAPLALRVN